MLDTLYKLRTITRELERDLGLDELSQAEKDILFAVRNLTVDQGQILRSDDIRGEDLVSEIPSATYHRALRSLVQRGLLARPRGARVNRYMLSIP